MSTPLDLMLRLVADQALMTDLATIAMALRALQPAGQQAAQGLQQVSTAQAKMSQSAQTETQAQKKLDRVDESSGHKTEMVDTARWGTAKEYNCKS